MTTGNYRFLPQTVLHNTEKYSMRKGFFCFFFKQWAAQNDLHFLITCNQPTRHPSSTSCTQAQVIQFNLQSTIRMRLDHTFLITFHNPMINLLQKFWNVPTLWYTSTMHSFLSETTGQWESKTCHKQITLLSHTCNMSAPLCSSCIHHLQLWLSVSQP